MTSTARKVFYSVIVLALLVWAGVGWVWWKQNSSKPEHAQDAQLAQAYTLPTIPPEVKRGVPNAPSISSATGAANAPYESVSLEPARILAKAPDYIEVITQTAQTPSTISKDRTAFFTAEERAGGIGTGEPVDFSSLTEDQIVYLVRNNFGILEQVLVKP